MLERKPEARIIALRQGKITLIPKFPEDIPRASPIVVVDLQDPRLVAHRQQKVAVRGRVYERITVGPVGQAVEMTVHVEIVEGVPGPHRIPIWVQIDDTVSQYIRGTRVTG